MFQTLARKHDRQAQRDSSSGVALSASSPSRARSPAAHEEQRAAPRRILAERGEQQRGRRDVNASASSGEPAQRARARRRGAQPQAAHRGRACAAAPRPPPAPKAPLIHCPIRSTRGLGARRCAARGGRRRSPPARRRSRTARRVPRCTTSTAQPASRSVEQRLPDLRGGAHIDAPRRLRDDQHLGAGVDLAADDVLLQVAARQAAAPAPRARAP